MGWGVVTEEKIKLGFGYKKRLDSFIIQGFNYIIGGGGGGRCNLS